MASACTVARMDDRESLMFDVGAKRPRDAPVPVHHATRHQTAMTSSCSANGGNTSDEEDGASEPHSSREFPSSSSGASAQGSPKRARATREGVRRGKWTLEEQAYADRLIRDFEAGLLPLENGATLRAYLSKKLNCDPMRISKKFAGAKCLGKVRFTLFLTFSPVTGGRTFAPWSLPWGCGQPALAISQLLAGARACFFDPSPDPPHYRHTLQVHALTLPLLTLTLPPLFTLTLLLLLTLPFLIPSFVAFSSPSKSFSSAPMGRRSLPPSPPASTTPPSRPSAPPSSTPYRRQGPEQAAAETVQPKRTRLPWRRREPPQGPSAARRGRRTGRQTRAPSQTRRFGRQGA